MDDNGSSKPDQVSPSATSRPAPRSGLRRTGLLAAALMVATAFAAACSSPSQDSSTCTDLKAVQSNFEELSNVNVITDGTNAFSNQLDQLRDSLNTLANDVGSQLESPVSTLESAVNSLVSTISSLGDRPLSDSADSIRSDLETIGSAYDEVRTTAESELSNCDLG